MEKIQSQIKEMPKQAGVYIMKDIEDKVLYVGKAKCLHSRVASYFRPSADHLPKIALMVKQVNHIDFIKTESEVEALILEARMIRELQPRYNTRQKDSKSYPYLAISKEEYPRVFITREQEYDILEKCKHYGPFTDSTSLKNSFKILQRIFRFRICNLNLCRENVGKFRPCLLASIGYCSGACANRISQEAYFQDIQSLESFLENGCTSLVTKLEQEMYIYAGQLKFEEAAKLRDQIKALQTINKRSNLGEFIPAELLHLDTQEILKFLQNLLGMSCEPRVIEGIDIAHHCGQEAVGSLVTFVDGIPYKEGYRRYRIRSACTNNDYAMLQEVLYRRFCGQDKPRERPDILLVDGGKGQLNAVMKVLHEINVNLSGVVSIAKKDEEIYVPGGKDPLRLPKDSAAHHLFCHIRDEAHRFAQNYHHHLKSKNIRNKKRRNNCEQ